MKRYIVALDEGTTSARAVVYDVSEKRSSLLLLTRLNYRILNPDGWKPMHSVYGVRSLLLSER